MTKDQLAKAIKQAAYLEGDFVLRSGKRSRYYLDKYLFETDPNILREIGRLLAASAGEDVHRIAGAELGGVPLAAAASLASGKPFVIVRAGRKNYGTAKRIEGILKPTEKVMLVEDVVTTGGQVLEAADLIRHAGAEVVKIVAVLDRLEGAADRIRQAGYTYETLFTSEDLGIVSQ